jgi:ferredoxin-NADP reductase
MEKHIVAIRSLEKITHDVVRITTDKPLGYLFIPGQATEIAINRTGWTDEKRPFTFSNLPGEDYLEFTIKTYPAHQGITSELLHLRNGDELILHEVFGAIAYKGQGIFIAGGAGITPFISIFRDLQSRNEVQGNFLVFANKTKADIIMEYEFCEWLGDDFVNILSDETVPGYHHGLINEEFLKAIVPDFQKQFYVCGPPALMEAIENQLTKLGVIKSAVTVEI